MAFYSLVFFTIICSASLTPATAKSEEDEGTNWALLVAGSKDFENYRHQADICHAYQILIEHGVLPENIIVMMYDDIAYNSRNPNKGVIRNKPGGENVYDGVKIDYKGEDVNSKAFLAVLQGKKHKVKGVGNGRVIESGPKDNIFINFVDHGAPGLLAFPSDMLKARQFNKAIQKMHKKGKYSQMVIYIEACNSGSMFEKLLPDDINVYVTTAANAEESSWACYFDKHLDTFLGDMYSVGWMEDSEVADLNVQTLRKQYKITKRHTSQSHVMEYGDKPLSREPVGEFQGDSTPDKRNNNYSRIPVDLDPVPSPDVDLYILKHKISKALTANEKQNLTGQLKQAYKHRDEIGAEMKQIISYALDHNQLMVSDVMTNRSSIINFNCYEPVVDKYIRLCRNIYEETYAMRVLYALQNACNLAGVKSRHLIGAIKRVC